MRKYHSRVQMNAIMGALSGSPKDAADDQNPAASWPADVEAGGADAERAELLGAEGTCEDPADLPLALVLLGRVGAGKSSTANTVMQPPSDARFVARRSAAAVTAGCRAMSGEVEGQKILVMDTPGLGDAAVPDNDVFAEIIRGFTEHIPAGSPVCLLHVMNLGTRVGEDELSTVEGIQRRVFGPVMEDRSIIVWTHADLLDDGTNVEDYLQGADVRLKELLTRFSGRWFSVCNKSQSANTVDPEVLKLLEAAAKIARPTVLKPRDQIRSCGRKTARRKRQLEAGLLRGRHEELLRETQPAKAESGAQPKQAESSGLRCMLL